MPITRSWQRDIDHAVADFGASLKIGSKVRIRAEPQVVLYVRSLDLAGRTDGAAKVLCFNKYGHGKWMRIDELEAVRD